MKRITLNIDLEDNEVFEEQVKEAIRAEVRGLVRSASANFIQQEAEKEANRLFNEDTRYEWNSVIRRTINAVLADIVRKEIETANSKSKICDEVEKRLEAAIGKFTPTIEKECRTAVKLIVNTEVAKRLGEILQ